MKKTAVAAALAAVPACMLACPALADSAHDHAPIGVMADHAHDKGEVMLSYRFMRMEMQGNRIGTDSATPDQIVTTVANPYAPPSTLRVVPTSMDMDMHMFGAMWAPTDRITLMAMANYVSKSMDHITYQGMMGTNRLGEFTVDPEGFGDTRLSAILSLQKTASARTVLAVGASLPTGSIDKSDTVLTPMNTTPELTLPYAMQLGSGTVDPFASITHAASSGPWSWGAQAAATLRLYDNSEDYHLGDEGMVTAWAGFSPVPELALTLRAEAKAWGEISGRDVRVGAPVQTANPENYGGKQLSLLAGANYAFHGALEGHRLAAEIGVPVYRDLNGPQMETDLTATLGWQIAF